MSPRSRRRRFGWLEVVLPLIGVVIAVGLYDKRGPLVAAVALVVYVGLFGTFALRREQAVAWSAEHPWLDGLLIIPFAFLALAYLTDIAIGGCVVIAVVLWLVLLPFSLRRGRRNPRGGVGPEDLHR